MQIQFTRVVAAALVALVAAPALRAQSCIGLPSLATFPKNVTAGVDLGDGVTSFGGRLGLGQPTLFGGVSANLVNYDLADEMALGIGGDIGFPIRLASTANSKVSFCPVASAGMTFGPSDATTIGLTAGASIGTTITSPGMEFIPFGALQLAHSRISVDGAGSASDTYLQMSGGLTLMFGGKVGIRPVVTIPFGLEGADPRIFLGAVFGLGKR